MHLRLLGLFGGLAVATTTVVFAACSPQNAGLISVTHVTPASYVRVLNGSPDLASIDVVVEPASTPTPAPKATPTASPSPPVNATGLAYQSMTAYGSTIGDVGIIVTVKQHGSSTTALSCTTTALAESDRYTVVIAGRATSPANTPTGLQCDVFLEDPPSITTGQALIGFHHAAPLFASVSKTAQGTVQYGTFPPGSTTYAKPVNFAGFTAPATGSNFAGGTATYGTITAVTTSPGVGVYASDGTEVSTGATPTPPTSIFASALPSEASVGFEIATPGADGANVLPFTVGTFTSYLFDVYLIDSTTSASKAGLVGTLD